MPTYERFEDVPAWKAAAELYGRVDDWLERVPPRMRGSFRQQLERAALSISNNIAEGFERGTTKEVLTFLYIARGSAAEVRSMLTVAHERPWLSSTLQAEAKALKTLSESCSKQLRAWAAYLQQSAVAGQRHLATYSKASRDTR